MITYYPYFRGRMYDLLALKALCEQKQLGPQIIPVIEPVRDSKELQQLVQAFINTQQPFSLIANPQVSVYGLNTVKRFPLPDLSNAPFYHPGAILAADFSSAFVHTEVGQTSLLLAPNFPLLQAYQDTEVLNQVSGVLIPNEARLHQLVSKQAILLTDSIVPPHHSDEPDLIDSYFSSAFWAHVPVGYQGFGDYSLMGSTYFDHGMPSRAITLHIIYVTVDGTLRIHHFVSDSNDSMRGQKQKFFEALHKLTAWAPPYLTGINQTPALNELLAYATTTKFPGLGTIKKLAIMHHLQLMRRLLALNIGA
ncbi:sce7725 family protein [Lactiplantibacillus herbarum]|uniref:sce7725 family protein n=1 Tax=Lactiplantibacillus herbarum TaxID=1670446 RepID=UPI00064E6FCC|nr:sce7725 family protein [Lactiplantibacillus herbarum]